MRRIGGPSRKCLAPLSPNVRVVAPESWALYGTSGNWDWVDGSSSSIDLTSAQSSIRRGGDSVNLAGGSDTATVTDGSETFEFQKVFGQDVINGFAASGPCGPTSLSKDHESQEAEPRGSVKACE